MRFMLSILSTVLCCLHDSFFFFNDTATTEIYTLSLHDALPISTSGRWPSSRLTRRRSRRRGSTSMPCAVNAGRSEEHTSELQSLTNLVCRLLLEKKKDAQARTGCSHAVGRERRICQAGYADLHD